ncbi:MAG: AraC family transcriptional regulator [Spirochaetota bacterium]
MDIVQRHSIPAKCRERFLPLSGKPGDILRARGISLAGISDIAAGYDIGRPSSTFHIALYTFAGGGVLSTETGERQLAQGDLLLAPKGCAYRYHAKRTWGIAWLHIDKPSFPKDIIVRASPSFRAVMQAMEGYLYETASGVEHRSALYASLIVDALNEAIMPRDADDAVRDRFSELWRAVNADIRIAWDAKALAERMSLSSAQCTRLCKRIFGKPPMQMVTSFRMKRAEELIAASDYPLADIAEAVGYTDVFAFSTAFKRVIGIAPSAVRRKGNG